MDSVDSCVRMVYLSEVALDGEHYTHAGAAYKTVKAPFINEKRLSMRRTQKVQVKEDHIFQPNSNSLSKPSRYTPRTSHQFNPRDLKKRRSMQLNHLHLASQGQPQPQPHGHAQPHGQPQAREANLAAMVNSTANGSGGKEMNSKDPLLKKRKKGKKNQAQRTPLRAASNGSAAANATDSDSKSETCLVM